MRTDIYIKLVIFLVSGLLIYSSITEYRYNLLVENGRNRINTIHKKNVSAEDYADGFLTAEDNFQKAILILPERDEAYYYLGTLYTDYINSEFERKLAITEETGLTEDRAENESISKLESVITVNPYNADAYLALAWLYEHVGKSHEADRLVARAEALWPEKLRVLQKVYEWAVLRKDMTKIQKLIDKIFAINPGMLLNCLNVLWRVEQDYEKIKALVPAKKKAREIFAKFLKSKEMINEARTEEEYAKTLE